MMDMYRNPDKLLQAMERLVPILVKKSVEQAQQMGSPIVGLMLHKRPEGFMSLEQFKTFHWPGLQKVMLGIIDCLTLAVGADTTSGSAALETARRIKAELGVNLTLAVSNIAFGLPDRHLPNSAFVAMAIAAGVTCLTVDVAKARPMVLAADLILNRDKRARRYIEAYRHIYRSQSNRASSRPKG